MNYTQNTKIMSITENTLIIGVDIAKEAHVARAINFRGYEYGKYIEFKNTQYGFDELIEWIEGIRNTNNLDKVILAMEPTGHYWFTLSNYLKSTEIEVVIVNPMHVKKSKELDDNSPTKNDIKDAKVIAQLAKDGRYSIPNIPEGVYAELRNAMDIKNDIDKRLNTIKNRMHRWLDQYFPEFKTVFKDIEGKAAIMTLKHIPLPNEIVQLGELGVLTLWRTEIKRAVGIKRATELVAIAKNSIGLVEGSTFAKYEMSYMIEDYTLLTSRMESVMQKVEQLLATIPFTKYLLDIKGIGILTVAGFISEVGDITKYTHPKQIIKLAGLNLKEHSSGKHKGQTRITKRGRSKLRAILFKAVMPLVAKNDEFKNHHIKLTTRSSNPLKKKQSLIAIACKLIRIFFAIGNKGEAYDPSKAFNNIDKDSLQNAA